MILKALVTATTLGLLTAGAAAAQNIYNPPAAEPYIVSKPLAPTAQATDTTEAKLRAQARAEAAANGNVAVVDGELRIPINADVAAKVGIPVEIVASAPVPDTPANRALYGGPMSNGGARTAPAGN